MAAILAKNSQVTELSTGSWQVNVEQQWHLYSSNSDVFATEHEVRQHFFQIVQTQQQLATYFSKPRCLAIMETGQHEQWRLWQLIKIQTSLADLLAHSLQKDDAKKFAARLFVAADEFVAAAKRFAELEIYLPLNLDNVGLLNNKTIFIGFVPDYLAEKPPFSIAANLEHSFKNIATAIIHQPDLKATQILDYLRLYANNSPEQNTVVEVLAKLLTESHAL